MEKLVVASTRKSSGKTSIIIGLARALKRKYRYIKPLGDRLVYRKKRSWDYDASLLTYLLEVRDNPEDVTLGFDHSKLRYMYTERALEEKLSALIRSERDALFVECGRDLFYGSSIKLDAVSIAKSIKGKLIIVVSGNEDTVLDDIIFVQKYLDKTGVELIGFIINKVHDIEDFRSSYSEVMEKIKVPILGIIPYQQEFDCFTVDYLSEHLFAKVICGEKGLGIPVKHIFVGAMSANEALSNPLFKRQNKLIVTSGDRSDMIITAMNSSTSGVLLTDNILPPPNVVSRASEMNIPLMLVSDDIYNVSRQIDRMEPLITRYNQKNISMLGDLVRQNVRLNDIPVRAVI